MKNWERSASYMKTLFVSKNYKIALLTFFMGVKKCISVLLYLHAVDEQLNYKIALPLVLILLVL